MEGVPSLPSGSDHHRFLLVKSFEQVFRRWFALWFNSRWTCGLPLLFQLLHSNINLFPTRYLLVQIHHLSQNFVFSLQLWNYRFWILSFSFIFFDDFVDSNNSRRDFIHKVDLLYFQLLICIYSSFEFSFHHAYLFFFLPQLFFYQIHIRLMRGFLFLKLLA